MIQVFYRIKQYLFPSDTMDEFGVEDDPLARRFLVVVYIDYWSRLCFNFFR